MSSSWAQIRSFLFVPLLSPILNSALYITEAWQIFFICWEDKIGALWWPQISFSYLKLRHGLFITISCSSNWKFDFSWPQFLSMPCKLLLLGFPWGFPYTYFLWEPGCLFPATPKSTISAASGPGHILLLLGSLIATTWCSDFAYSELLSLCTIYWQVNMFCSHCPCIALHSYIINN